MKSTTRTLTLVAALSSLPLAAQETTPVEDGDAATATPASAPVAVAEAPKPSTFDTIALDVQQELKAAVAESDALFQKIADERLPLNRELSQLERDLVAIRAEFQEVTRELDGRTVELQRLKDEITRSEADATRLEDVFTEYAQKFESRLHITEIPLFEELLGAAERAKASDELEGAEVYAAQLAVLDASMDRIDDALGGRLFDGSAVDADGNIREGQIMLIGPSALFRSADGVHVGTAEQKLNSYEPKQIPFLDPDLEAAASRVVASGSGTFVLDPTLGGAHVTAATETTVWEEIEKGGEVMIPITGMAGLALLVALYKWAALSLQRKPSRKKVAALLEVVGNDDTAEAEKRVQEIKGPVGRMLQAGVAHLDQPRALIEEVMYEKVLVTKLQLQKLLPFIAICAASAPLLGLLGTVSGIINTFKVMTMLGGGDAKSLSGGISEALITTKYGLVVAIPSLLLHAFLSRKARGLVDQMETSAIAFVNEVSKTPAPVRSDMDTAA